MSEVPYISTSCFYSTEGKNTTNFVNEPTTCVNAVTPYRITSLLKGPPLTWKLFNKQADALHFTSRYKGHLMPFAFESGSTRLFLAAHPEVFWHYYIQRLAADRCSYEIISEGTACKLYFDIEFNKIVNPQKNGLKMAKDFIYIVIFYLNVKLQVGCSYDDVLNLDSSTDLKFSCHLIFNIPGVCFCNNKQAGNFVNYICDQILNIVQEKLLPEHFPCKSLSDCCDLLVTDQKGNVSVFCDRSVYSRNRHFRLYLSTKYGKGVPLILSPLNGFQPKDPGKQNCDRDIFYASLITYITEDFEKLKILSMNYTSTNKVAHNLNSESPASTHIEGAPSPFKTIDDFINDSVFPGKIYRSCYFSTSRVVNYDIVGNRFCGNIGRPHKRNNIKYIVDLNEGVYYQKCHDFDCYGYRSEKKPLPAQLLPADDTKIEDISSLGMFDLPRETSTAGSLERFPSCGLGDEEIINHLENESVNDSSERFPSCGLGDEDIINHLEEDDSRKCPLERFPSFGLKDEEIISHLIQTESINCSEESFPSCGLGDEDILNHIVGSELHEQL